MLEHIAKLDGRLAMGDSENQLAKAHLFQLKGGISEGSAARANVVNDKDFLALILAGRHTGRIDNVETLNLAGFPVANLLAIEELITGDRVDISLLSALVGEYDVVRLDFINHLLMERPNIHSFHAVNHIGSGRVRVEYNDSFKAERVEPLGEVFQSEDLGDAVLLAVHPRIGDVGHSQLNLIAKVFDMPSEHIDNRHLRVVAEDPGNREGFSKVPSLIAVGVKGAAHLVEDVKEGAEVGQRGSAVGKPTKVYFKAFNINHLTTSIC